MVVRNEAPPHIVPIERLNAYQARWTIRARVTAKCDMKVFSNARGDGAPPLRGIEAERRASALVATCREGNTGTFNFQ